MAINPCCCMTLQKGSQALAIFDAVISMINLGLMILALAGYIRYDSKRDLDLTETERTIGIIIIIILCVMCVLQVLLAFRLYYGARKRNYRQCRIWLIITIISTAINSINFVLNFTITDFNEVPFSGTLVNILYKLYEMLVVFFFLKELKLNEIQGLDVGYTENAYPQPQPEQTDQVYVIPQSQEAYPMQQYSPYPTTTVTNQNYPAPVHHVTSSRIS